MNNEIILWVSGDSKPKVKSMRDKFLFVLSGKDFLWFTRPTLSGLESENVNQTLKNWVQKAWNWFLVSSMIRNDLVFAKH